MAFSNSVIEHVPKELQGAFASEVRRVADRYFVQTPNKWFPIEPHYQLPLVQFLPERLLKALNRRFSFGWREKGRWEPITLLSAGELRRLFPDAEIHRERVFGLTKSLMAVRRDPVSQPPGRLTGRADAAAARIGAAAAVVSSDHVVSYAFSQRSVVGFHRWQVTADPRVMFGFWKSQGGEEL